MCKVENCNKPIDCRELCENHYRKFLLDGTIKRTYKPRKKNEFTKCAATNCDRNSRALNLCKAHFDRFKRTGRIDEHLPIGKTGQVNFGWINKDGYMIKKYNGSRKLVHRAIMEEHIGRDLYSHENVHHINGDRADNRIENLELWSTSQPSGQRVEDKIKWALELINQYPEIAEQFRTV